MVYIIFKHFELPAMKTLSPHVTRHCLVGGMGARAFETFSWPSPTPDLPTKHIHFCPWCFPGLMYIGKWQMIICLNGSAVKVLDLVMGVIGWGFEPGQTHSFFHSFKGDGSLSVIYFSL